jgi:hypothetical protein
LPAQKVGFDLYPVELAPNDFFVGDYASEGSYVAGLENVHGNASCLGKEAFSPKKIALSVTSLVT